MIIYQNHLSQKNYFRIKNILDKTLKTEQVRIIEFANVKIDLKQTFNY